MKFSFNNILVPVDFTINTQVAVEKALALADGEGTTLTLLHVRKASTPTPADAEACADVRQLQHWCMELETNQPGLSVRWVVDNAASIEECIIQYTGSLECDLVVIGKTKKNHWIRFSDTIVPTRIAEKTGVPVLTARPGSLQTRVRTIVVPISEVVPQRKMAALSLLCNRLHPTIHLVAFGSNAAVSAESAGTLLQVYQWVRRQLHCPVTYALLDEGNKSRALLAYAAKVEADMLLVNPCQETKVDIWNRHITDVLPPESKVQVLAVQPETELLTM